MRRTGAGHRGREREKEGGMNGCVAGERREKAESSGSKTTYVHDQNDQAEDREKN